MKISLNWLSDYLPIQLSLNELSDLLTDIGLEVEGIEKVESVKGGLENLVIGEVLECEQHSNADRLKVCKVTIGKENYLQIVCGAPNVKKGQKVVVAPVGTTIYPLNSEPFTIGEAKIRGVKSFGMLCAEDEIGLGENHDGILVLRDDAPVGEDAKEYFNVTTDTVIEIGLTPNRSDANSHLGTARDLAAALVIQYNQKEEVNWPDNADFSVQQTTHPIQVKVEAIDACPRYAGIVLSNLNIQPSPQWMQNRLKAVGVKPINNIVDITNYINHEYGQPLHAFDYDKIAEKQIIVKNLKEGSTFTTLDGEERKLSEEDLMICDAEGGMCIAGVYGGLNTGVSDNTTSIFLESAYFDPSTIRRTELRHNLRTDAAAKFEKGIDPTKQVEALKRASLLIQELAGGVISSDLVDIHAREIQAAQIDLNYERLNHLTGVEFKTEIVKKIVRLLDFKILDENELGLQLEAPLYRADVTREADVIEEILRIYGFNNIPLKGSTEFSFNYATNKEGNFRNKIADDLSGKGFQEIMTNSISRSSYYQQLNGINEEQFVRPINSLNSELDVMRPDLLMTGLETIAYNKNRNMPSCSFYEFGRVYANYKGKYHEANHLAIYLSGQKNKESWLAERQEFGFYDCKYFVESVLQKSGINNWKETTCDHEFFQEAVEYQKNKKSIVRFGIIHKRILSRFDIEDAVLFADFDFDYLLQLNSQSEQLFTPISKYPSIERDLALVLDSSVNYKQIKDLANQKGGEYLSDMNLFDVYESEEKLGKEKKSYAVSFTFENKEETLTNKEIDKQVKLLIKAFENKLGAEIRS